MRPVIGINSDVNLDEGHWRLRVPTAYVEAVAAADGLPLVVPAMLPPDMLWEHVARCHGFLFVGGNDYPPEWYGEEPHPDMKPMQPVRAAADMELMRAAMQRGMPVLGVCAGMQLLAIARGGRLIQHLPHPEAHGEEIYHKITIRGGHLLRRMLGEGEREVNSWHHQAVHPEAPGENMLTVARAEDGTVEAIEDKRPGMFRLGVQWHPERIRDLRHRQALFGAFVAAAAGVPSL